MTRIEDTHGIKRNSSILPTHNLTTIDNNVRVVFQRAFKTLVNNVFLFLLNIKLKLHTMTIILVWDKMIESIY